ncbi:MAG: DUF1828 domain-containing protein [Bryobacteraceae bacterium]|nr:DUF1828 domain-containing protein [Bryobacteraceae bacterium]
MIDCSLISSALAPLSLVQQCDSIGNGSLRLLTPFQYPNGSQIDLFLEEPQPLFNALTLSDLGQTTAYLLDAQVRPWATNKRRQIVEDICRSLDVRWHGGRLLIELEPEDLLDLRPVMMRLAQACIRVSDLVFSARIWSTGSFRDEMEEFLTSLEIRYEPDAIETNRKGQDVKFDFRVFGATHVSLLQSLSAASTGSAHSVSAEAFLRLFDVGATKRKTDPQFVTVIDESNDVFKDHDITRLEQVSSVFWFPAQQDQLISTLVV